VVIGCRRALLLRWPSEPKPHLWIVITDPIGNPPTVAIVPLRTKRRHSDTTVVLDVGDHPFIRHPTVVHYSDLQVVRVSAILRCIRDRHAQLVEDVSEELLERIRNGLERSPFTVKAHLEYCLARR